MKNLKLRGLFAVAMLSVTFVASAGEDCKFKKAKPAGQQTKKIFLVRKAAKAMSFAVGRDAGEDFVWIEYARHFSKGLRLNDTTPLTFIFAEGEPLTLLPWDDTRSKHQGSIVLGSKLIRVRYLVGRRGARATRRRASRRGTLRLRREEAGPRRRRPRGQAEAGGRGSRADRLLPQPRFVTSPRAMAGDDPLRFKTCGNERRRSC